MRKTWNSLLDTFIAGLIFLLPILIVCVVISKVFRIFRDSTEKLAAIFGLKSMLGVSGSTIMSILLLGILCIICGYLMRIAFFKHFNQWLDNKLREFVPGYEIYRQMALSKLERKQGALPYECAAWVKTDNGVKPAFVMEALPDGRLVMFFPSAGNIREGEIIIIESNTVERCPDYNMSDFNMAIANLGLGFAKMKKIKKGT